MAVLAIVFAPRFQDLWLPGILIMAIGSAIRVWAAGHITKNQALSTGGPYAFTRNPLYLGTMVGGIGSFILIRNWWLLALYIVGFALFYGSTIKSEEEYLSEKFGDEFERFRKSVPVLLPRITPSPSAGESRFSWQGVLKHREYQGVTWGVILIALILLRAWIR